MSFRAFKDLFICHAVDPDGRRISVSFRNNFRGVEPGNSRVRRGAKRDYVAQPELDIPR